MKQNVILVDTNYNYFFYTIYSQVVKNNNFTSYLYTAIVFSRVTSKIKTATLTPIYYGLLH